MSVRKVIGVIAGNRRFKMTTSLLVIAAVFFVLYGLIASTEKRLTQRQNVVIDERMTEHRSRF
jgi:high-affinity Fe2+/Pb2+ permease